MILMPPMKPANLNRELFPTDVPKPESARPEAALIAHIDGGARGNPGPAGYGVFVQDANRRTVAELSRYLGRQTNNYAEYSGLIAALEYALQHGYRALRVYSDSELLVKQIKGIYKVRNEGLRPLYERAQKLILDLEDFRIEHVRREQNREADRLANRAMDEGTHR
jgi:ribonuclease HI